MNTLNPRRHGQFATLVDPKIVWPAIGSSFIKLDPRSADAYINRGNAERDRLALGDAIADYTRAIDLSPSAALAFYNRAWARYLGGDNRLALADVDQAIKLNPGSASAFSTRGLIRERLSDSSGAIADFHKALAIDPSFQQPAEGLRRLQAGTSPTR